MRLFAGIWPTEEVRKHLVELQDSLRARLDAGRSLRFTRPDQCHLTLLFLGEVADGQAGDVTATLRDAVTSLPGTAFRLRVEGAGCFPDDRRPRVIWAGLGGQEGSLQCLQAAVASALGRFVEPRVRASEPAFRPHITLARAREWEAGDRDLLREWLRRPPDPVTSPDWWVNQVRLVRSRMEPDGTRYETMAEFELKPASP